MQSQKRYLISNTGLRDASASKNHYSNEQININTSSDVSWQGDKLREAFPSEVIAHLFDLVGAKVDVAYHQCVLFRVDEILEMAGCSIQRFFLRPVDGNYVHFSHFYLDHLNVGLSQLADADHSFQLTLHKHSQSFSSRHTLKVTCEPFNLVANINLFSFLQPRLLEAQDVALKQHRVASDVLHVLAEGESVEGAHLETLRFPVHPLARIFVDRDFLHPGCFRLDLFIDIDFLRVQGIYDVQLLQGLTAR